MVEGTIDDEERSGKGVGDGDGGIEERLAATSGGFYMHPRPKFLVRRIRVGFPKKH